MPPLATVTLESVQQPGEWEVLRPQGAAAAVHGECVVQVRVMRMSESQHKLF